MPDTKTVVGVFTKDQTAEQAVDQLRENGFSDNEISIIGKGHHEKEHAQGGMMHQDVSQGATWGAGMGGAAGLLASAGALAIPGIGPLVAMGPLAATLGVAAGGGLAGALVDYGIPENQSKGYERQVREGHFLVVCKTAGNSQKCQSLLREAGAQDVHID